MDGAKQFASTHGSFLHARRSHGSLKDELPRLATTFPANAAGDSGERDDGGFPKISLFDTLQLNLGKKTVENATLATDILRLQRVVVELQKTKGNDYGTKLQKFAELEATLLNQNQELSRVISDRNIYRNLHEEVNAELENLKLEKVAGEQDAQKRLSELEYLCQRFEEEKRDIEQRCKQQLENKEKECEKMVQNLRSQESNAEVAALEDERRKHAAEIADLLNERTDRQSELQQALDNVDSLQIAHANMEGKLQEQISMVHQELTQHMEVCEKEKSEIEEASSHKNLGLVNEIAQFKKKVSVLEDEVRVVENSLKEKDSCIATQHKKHEEQVNVWRRRVTEAMLNSSQLMAETVANLEHKLAEADAQRARLAVQNEQRAQEAAEHLDLVRKEYDVIIRSLTTQHEEDFKRRALSIEEQFTREARQWKAEYEKIRDEQQQYARMVDARLEQHVKSLKDAHQAEMANMDQQVKDLSTSSFEHQELLATLRQNLTTKEKDLKSATKKAADLEKKQRSGEKKLNELAVMNEKLVSDISQLRQLKDPSTIVETTLRAERENLRSAVEAEHAAQVASSEALLAKKHEEALAILQQKHNDSLHQLEEQLKLTMSERAQSRATLQKLQSEVAAEKQATESRIAELAKRNTASSIMDAQNHQIELRTQKENHRRELQSLKADKLKVVKAVEVSHEEAAAKLRAVHENEKLAIARANEEVLRSYAHNTKPSIRKEIEEEMNQQIRMIRSQHSSLIAANEKALLETEQKCGLLLENTKKSHQETVNNLEKKIATMAKALTEFEGNFAHQQQSLSEALMVKEVLERRIEEAERHLQQTIDHETSKRKTVQEEVRKQAEQKLLTFQETSSSTIEKLEKQLRSLLQEMAKAEERERLLAQKFAAVSARNHDLEGHQAAFQRRLQQSEQRIPEILASI